MHRVLFAPRAERDFRKLGPTVQKQLDPAIQALAENPRPPGCKKLTGEPSLWRIRSGDYRIIYQVQDQQLVVLVLKVGHRREIYR
jgi:mRNA interferase RelE/StbE